MKLKTSFFNGNVLKKDIIRFSPVWAVYTIILLLYMFNLSDMGTTALRANNVADSMTGIAWLNFFYAGLCGVFLFMDLFNPRLCNALHAFPIKREGWLITHCIAGTLFSLIPNLLVTILASFMLQEYAYIAFLWLPVAMLQFIFFFATAVLSALCAGNLLGMSAIYGIIHFLSVLIYAVAGLIYQPLLHGVQFKKEPFYLFFPLYQMTGKDYVKIEYTVDNSYRHIQFLGFESESWLYLGICAAISVVIIVLAWHVYRHRKLESSGNFLSLKPLSPVFLIICAIGVGAFLYLFSEVFGEKSYLFLIIGLIIGYFAGLMLLNRTLRVFGKKSIIGLGILIAVLASTLCLTRLDPAGITTYIPDIGNVKSATVVGADRRYYYADSFGIINNDIFTDRESGFRITERNELVQLQDFHKQLTRTRNDNENSVYCDVVIQYTLKSGKTITRYYKVPSNSSLGERAGEYFSDMRYVFQVSDTDILYGMFESVRIDGYASDASVSVKLTDKEEINGLLDAIKADCEANAMAQNWAYHEKEEENYYIHFSVDNWDYEKDALDSIRTSLDIWTNCVNTTDYLRDMVELHRE